MKRKCMRMFTSILLAQVAFGDQTAKLNISQAQARRIALNTYYGRIENEELQKSQERWVYSFDIRRPGGGILHEVQVDAGSGKVVCHITETVIEEAAEKNKNVSAR